MGLFVTSKLLCSLTNRTVGLARRCFYGPGVKYVASHSTHTVVANPKKPTRTCKFCSQCKSVANCPRRNELKLDAIEYILSTNDLNVQERLNERFSVMPVHPGPKRPVFGNVSAKNLKANFIIHSASLVAGGEPGIHGMNFCVSFLKENAEANDPVWVSGSAMNSMATHTYKKNNYVYDQTFFHKDGWSERISAPNSLMQMTRYEGSDEDDIPISILGYEEV